MTVRTLFLLVPIGGFHLLLSPAGSAQTGIDSLGIEVRHVTREFSFTNKESAFYYGETHSENQSSWQGFNVAGFEFVDDYLLVIDGTPLERGSVDRVVVYPDRIERFYPRGITERVFLADSLAVLGIFVTAQKPVQLSLIPLFTDGRSTEDYTIILTDSAALLTRHPRKNRVQQAGDQPWLAIGGRGCVPARNITRHGVQFSPLLLSSRRSKNHILCFTVGKNRQTASTLVRSFPAKAGMYSRARRERMERLLERTLTRTGDAALDRALAWAKLSLDALVMNYPTRGIYAGLPWFNNYWGRDTFISFPGAVLVTGRFPEAKQILRSFAEYQERDSTSTDYGRIPNVVSAHDIAYNTADGTPRFVAMVREYIERSADSPFASEIYPVVLRSIEGTLRYHVDSLCFLTHDDAETWMDAVGPDGPWSPRGNRANDIQALWSQQLDAGIWLATLVGDLHRAQRWDTCRKKLYENFRRFFVQEGLVVDHLNTDGSPDTQLRPNQIFTHPMLDPGTRASVLRAVTSELTYPYGVASLSQEDEQFHPYHQYPPFYPKDAAYHNGIVWTWVQGRLISELVLFGQPDLAYQLTCSTVHQILTRGAVGTQSELLEAVARPGEAEPRLSGTFSQAWNLAEFIRNFYEDFLGVRANMREHTLVLRPMIPESMRPVDARVSLGNQSIQLRIEEEDGSQTVQINAEGLETCLQTWVTLPGTPDQEIQFGLLPHSHVKVEMNQGDVTLYVNGDRLTPTLAPSEGFDLGDGQLAFLRPHIRPGLKSLKGPDYPLIPHTTIKATSMSGRVLLDIEDPMGDDRGTGACSGQLSYPSSPPFVEGCLDLTRFAVAHEDDTLTFNLQFRALSDPGWHPEYGFQLTYVAIAIDTDGKSGSGTLLVGHNAKYRLDSASGYERLILVGGGVHVEDQDGTVLAAYVPTESDVSNPLGDVVEGAVVFAIPVSLMGEPSGNWRFTVLVGGQDDHGGAGLGEFREVQAEASEWHGGGKRDTSEPNVYDDLVATPDN
ncbi:MAG: hypothetical protein KAJ12_01700 [Bacteroidetes bacterium]|nr:hypothetical protein [Bacteroidota bacterium]